MTICFFDIETISTTRADYRDRIAETIKPPGTMKKTETIEKWEKEEKENAINEAIEKSVFDGGLCHIVQIQYAFNNDDVKVNIYPEDYLDESGVITSFFLAVESNETSLFVGHNISGFDLRILKQRAIVLGIKIPLSLNQAINSKPWDGRIFDTMTEWSGYGNKVSIDNLCYYLGIESPKQEITGANYGKHYRGGEYDKLIKYGKDEIESLRKVYKKIKQI